jgi:hypothetical protein
MSTRPRRQGERGAALIIALILISVASLIAVSSMRGSRTQEMMTSNQNNKLISHMAAEAGASRFLSWVSTSAETDGWSSLNSWKMKWQYDKAKSPAANADRILARTSDSVPLLTGADDADNVMLPPHGHYWIDTRLNDNKNPEWFEEEQYLLVRITGSAMNGNSVLAETVVEIKVDWESGELGETQRALAAFYAGILAGGNVSINGNAKITGNGHANGNFWVTGGNSEMNDRETVDESGNPVTVPSFVSAGGNAQVKGKKIDPDNVVSYASSQSVPSARDYISEYVADSSNTESSSFVRECSIPSDGSCKKATKHAVPDCGGKVFYCVGNATTDDRFSNATIIATGNITHGGASQMGADSRTLTVALIAGGNITVNGKNDTYGVFWADGNIVQNGASTLGGSLVAGGNVTRNGNFTYEQYDIFSSDLAIPQEAGAPTTARTTITGWSEVLP